MLQRRDLILGAGVALAGSAAAQAADPAKAPRGLSRFRREIAAAQERLDAFMTAFNARDLTAFEATFNFPHVRFASGTVSIIQPGYHTPEMFEEGALKGWDHSAWLRREVIHAGTDKVHIDTQFARYRKDGSLIGTYDSIYIVTRLNARWGIQGRSSFAA